MSNRQPGDYVVNAELTTEQIERFVADCVEAGAKRDLDDDVEHRYTSFYTEKMVGTTKVQGGAGFRNRDQVNNVTDSYKAQPMTDTPDLPTVLEECAEHLRAGRDPKHYYEVRVSGFWHHPDTTLDIASAADRGAIRRKPTHKTPTEDDVGRLVMVPMGANHWKGPYVLQAVGDDPSFPYDVHEGDYMEAKLYTGPTRPNWIEHDGGEAPDDVHEEGCALAEDTNGDLHLVDPFHPAWEGSRSQPRITRYTIIKP